jgi:chorismate mutase/prephenate dehydratase
MATARTPIDRPKVVYQGVAGAYSEMACIDFFGDGSENVGLEQFEDVFQALKKGEADYAVLPIENSTSGAIRQVYDLMSQYECYIVGETTVQVEHCLMAPKGASFDTITHVYSHEQGLFQSDRFLNAHPHWVQVPCADTAGAGQYVAQTGDITKAAICSERAAELYGLEILVRGTNHNANNTTRFVVVSPVMELRAGADKISTVFSLPHEAGTGGLLRELARLERVVLAVQVEFVRDEHMFFPLISACHIAGGLLRAPGRMPGASQHKGSARRRSPDLPGVT